MALVDLDIQYGEFIDILLPGHLGCALLSTKKWESSSSLSVPRDSSTTV